MHTLAVKVDDLCYKLSDLGYNNVRAIDHVDCAKKEQR
jgi:hypothetical protein